MHEHKHYFGVQMEQSFDQIDDLIRSYVLHDFHVVYTPGTSLLASKY